MAKKIKVQDGNISYSNTDPSLPITFNVGGTISASDDINAGGTINAAVMSVGNISATEMSVGTTETAGVITTSNGGNLTILPDENAFLYISQNQVNSGLYLNGIKWPDTTPTLGSFLSITAQDTLSYQSLILGTTSNNSLTAADLNALYPLALPGQYVVGDTSMYFYVGQGAWRQMAVTALIPAP